MLKMSPPFVPVESATKKELGGARGGKVRGDQNKAFKVVSCAYSSATGR